MVRQPVEEKENSEFKSVLLSLEKMLIMCNIQQVAGELGKYIHYFTQKKKPKCVRVCVYVYVCVWERKREREQYGSK